MSFRKIFFSFLATSPILIAMTLSTISCSKNIESSNKKDIDDNDIDKKIKDQEKIDEELIDKDILNEDFVTKINWINGFKDEKTTFIEQDHDYIFKYNEIIFEDLKYRIEYIGKNNGVSSFSIQDKNINKFYTCSVNASYEKLSKKYTYTRVKNFISKNIIENYEKNMIVEHRINDENFFIPVDNSTERIRFEKNEKIDFKSSWGVLNSSRKDLNFKINFNKENVREMLFGSQEKNFQNYQITNIEATDLFILPRAIIMNHPVSWFEFNINSVRDNVRGNFLNLSNDEKNRINIDLPNGKNPKKRYSCNILGKEFKGDIINTYKSDGISSTIDKAILWNDDDKMNVLDRIVETDKKFIKNYYDEIVTNGKRVKINQKLNNYKDFELSINSSIKAGAKAVNLFGDRTETAIYTINGIQKMNVTFKEYKKF